MPTILSILRPVNLFLVLLTQQLIYHLLANNLASVDIIPILSSFQFNILCIVTLLVAGGGYIINDYFDFNIDLKYKSKKQFRNRGSYLVYYAILIITGSLLAIFLAHDIGKIGYSLLYLLATLVLFLYSSHLKNTVLLGNILISTFTAMVIAVLLLAEWPSLAVLKESHYHVFMDVMYLVVGLIALTFISNLIREVAKDFEDLVGDKKNNVYTVASSLNNTQAKILLLVLSGVLISLTVIWLKYTLEFNIPIITVSFSAIILVTELILMGMIFRLEDATGYRRVSNLSKVIMFAGLLYTSTALWT